MWSNLTGNRGGWGAVLMINKACGFVRTCRTWVKIDLSARY